ncbi:hypothetical protein KFK09_012618 [Dendrobium nobile]|uniref:Uncharacterized protein n=1 Tax=Dendrobium nobile TaxID=94219 RepID=A0A8T3BHZ0_DENNO|nr:hypothetical protein KFK09_012618 [Dendrobium nobile]
MIRIGKKALTMPFTVPTFQTMHLNETQLKQLNLPSKQSSKRQRETNPQNRPLTQNPKQHALTTH